MSALRILYLEDNTDHVNLVLDALQFQFPGTQIESASLLSEVLLYLEKRRYDVVLVNAILHQEPILPHLAQIVEIAQGTPVLVISGSGDEKSAANAIKLGAADYLVKSRETLEVLPYLIHRLLKKRRPIVDIPSTVSTAAGADHLMTEIDQVARRIHSLQDSTVTETTLQSLRDDIQQLKQFALQLSETRKPGKSKITN